MADEHYCDRCAVLLRGSLVEEHLCGDCAAMVRRARNKIVVAPRKRGEYGEGPHRRAGSISEVDDKVEALSEEHTALVKRLVWLEENRHALCPSNAAAGDVAETARREAKDARVKAARASKDVGEALDILDRNHIRLRTLMHVVAALLLTVFGLSASFAYWAYNMRLLIDTYGESLEAEHDYIRDVNRQVWDNDEERRKVDVELRDGIRDNTSWMRKNAEICHQQIRLRCDEKLLREETDGHERDQESTGP